MLNKSTVSEHSTDKYNDITQFEQAVCKCAIKNKIASPPPNMNLQRYFTWLISVLTPPINI